MANLNYVRGNRLREQTDEAFNRTLLFGIVAVVILSAINPGLGMLGFVVLGVLHWFGSRDRARRLHGAAGEDLALGAGNPAPGSLATLPDSFAVFNQLEVPFKGGHAEIDFVVVGPNGVFAVETKHDRGTIRGTEKDRQWVKAKVSSGGNTYEREIRNPVAQSKRAVYALRTYLESKGIKAWIHGLVVYTHPDCALEVDGGNVPILRLDALAGHVAHFGGARRRPDVERVIAALIPLATSDPVARSDQAKSLAE